MAEARRRGAWGRRLTLLGAVLSFGAVAIALVAAFGSGQEWWHFRLGLQTLRYCFYAAIAGGLMAIVAMIVRRRGGAGIGLINIAALVVALAFGFYLYSLYRTATTVPPIHDVATNLDDLPEFRRLPVREDNLKSLEKAGRPDLEPLAPRERWLKLHREAYSDLATLRVPWPVAQTVQRAEQLARDRGWEVAAADPAGGHVEAVATTRFFRFKDNVVLRVRPAPDGRGSLVDMRSISRVGGSDVGANAARIRSFLADLQSAG
ncbi:MAG TPA: DUF1499 domain-containing protein [Allosphingosinicella sp.]|jgi:hypothetical protein